MIHHVTRRLFPLAALALLVGLSPGLVHAQVLAGDGQAILIRRTIPYPQAVDRAPLTSDRLSTTSTRYIDARRGLRPYSAVYGTGYRYGCRVPAYAGYDDHFGISRAVDRPFSYSQRTLRTGVTRFQNTATTDTSRATVQARAIAGPVQPITRPRPVTDDRIRIHRDRSTVPTTRGAVLILSDGTVIQVGE